jgi:hypothetical protein
MNAGAAVTTSTMVVMLVHHGILCVQGHVRRQRFCYLRGGGGANLIVTALQLPASACRGA